MDIDKDNPEFLLSQYLDGQLSPAEMERLEERLGDDGLLRRELQRYAALGEMLSSLPPSPELDQIDFDAQRHDIMAQLERKALLVHRPRSRVFRLTLAGSAIAAMALVAISAWLFFHSQAPTAAPAPSNAIAVSTLVQPEGAPAATIEVAVMGAAPAMAREPVVAVNYGKLADKDYLPQKKMDFAAAPTGTVLMIGAAPRAPKSLNGLAELMSTD